MNNDKISQWVAAGLFSIILSGCGSESQTIVDDVPDAENLLFTDDGRLFVSGGSNVFEIVKKPDGSFIKLDTFHGDCTVEGIIVRDNYLYGVCNNLSSPDFLKSFLIGGEIVPMDSAITSSSTDGIHPSMTLTTLSPLADVQIANGMEVDNEGNLYFSDSGDSRIFKIILSDPTTVADLQVWADNFEYFANGIKWVGDRLYTTAMKSGTITAQFGYIERQPDGSGGDFVPVYERKSTVLDDFLPTANGFLLTDYLKGSLVYLQDNKVVAETPKDTFYSPTAVIIGQPPMFSNDVVLVTEKGIIFEQNSMQGNKLGLYQLPWSLN